MRKKSNKKHTSIQTDHGKITEMKSDAEEQTNAGERFRERRRRRGVVIDD